MKNKVVKTVLALVLGVAIFFVACLVGVVDIADGLFADAKSRINDYRINNLIRKETKLDIRDTNDFYGLWKDSNSSYSERYEALIDEDSITLYRYEDNVQNIYWVGTFDVGSFTNERKTIESKNCSFVSNMIENAAKSDTKTFTYEGGKIKFISQYNDGYKEIVLERYDVNVDRLRVVKFPGERKSYYDEKTNKTLNIGGYQISYPSYFDHVEEETEENIIDKWLAPADYKSIYRMINNNFLVYSPSNTDAYGELFIGEYVKANIYSIEELDSNIKTYSYNYLDKNNVIISKDVKEGENYDWITYVYSDRYDDVDNLRTIYGMIFETHLLMKETNTSLIVSVSYSYDDVSDYDYLSDYAKVIKGIKKVE